MRSSFHSLRRSLPARLALAWWHTTRRSALVLWVVAFVATWSFGVVFVGVRVDTGNLLALATHAFALPAFFWWLAAGQFLIARAPASALALVPRYRATHVGVVLLHVATTTALPAGLVAALGGHAVGTLAGTLFWSGLGAFCGVRGARGFALAIATWCLGAYFGAYPRVGATAHNAVVLALLAAGGAALFAAWWLGSLGGRAERRWRAWSAQLANAAVVEASLRYGGTGPGAGPFGRLEERVHAWLDRRVIARFRTAPRRAAAAMLAIGFGRLQRQVTLAWFVGVALLLYVVAMHGGPNGAHDDMLRVAWCAAFLHGYAFFMQAHWLRGRTAESELLTLAPRLDPGRRFGALVARNWLAFHGRLAALNAAAWLAAGVALGLPAVTIALGLSWLALVATIAGAAACGLFVRRVGGYAAATAALLWLIALHLGMRAAYGASDAAPLATVGALTLVAALVAAYAYRRVAARLNPFATG
jgi:hypothetical protein